MKKFAAAENNDPAGLCAQNCITGSRIFAERYGALGLTYSQTLSQLEIMQ
jgi:hypothetical protein